MSMRYFITGTAGFIGFHLARRLLQDGHEVTGFDGMTHYYNIKLKHMRNAALAQNCEEADGGGRDLVQMGGAMPQKRQFAFPILMPIDHVQSVATASNMR